MVQVGRVDVLKAWAVYFVLKCAVVISVMHIGERLGFLIVSLEIGPSVQEGVGMAWAALAVYYAVVAVIAAFVFRWAVNRFVVSKMDQEKPVDLSLHRYFRVWVAYAAITFVLGHLIATVLEYLVFEFMLGRLAEALWAGWLRVSVRPIVLISVSLVVFEWAVIKLLLGDRIAGARPMTK